MMRVRDSLLEPYQSIHKELHYNIRDIESARKISSLLQNLFSIGIQNIKIQQNNDPDKWSSVKVDLKKEQHKKLNGADLFIPQTLKFNIDCNGISFEEGYAPIEINDSCCGSLINRLTWMEISVKNDQFQFASPRWVGVGCPFAGGTPNVYSLPIQDVLKAL